jgi:hypothetical protein
MPDNSKTPLSLPPGVTDADAKVTIERWAPLIRLHKFERHLPSEPEIFRKSTRFRESRFGDDRGWNKHERIWKTGDLYGSDYQAAGWDDIVHQSGLFLARHDPNRAQKSLNARPRDDKNVCGEGSVNGLFLERVRRLRKERSGMPTSAVRQIDAPVFVDIYYDPEHHMVRVLYWFFYELNHWHFMITHEGDWEHVTMVYREEHFRQKLAPKWVYFAQHNHGEIFQYVDLDRYDQTHRIVYVDKVGHPCHADVDHRYEYVYEWKTWEDNRIQFVPRAEWRDFAGAWGEVGETKHTTGPLGPTFKRVDNIRIRKIGIKSYVIMKRR